MFILSIRILWTTLLAVALSQTYSALVSCENPSSGETIVSYLFVSIFAFSIAIFCEMRIFGKIFIVSCLSTVIILSSYCYISVISFRGTVIESDERNGMNIYLVVKVIIGFLQLLLAIIGVNSIYLYILYICIM